MPAGNSCGSAAARLKRLLLGEGVLIRAWRSVQAAVDESIFRMRRQGRAFLRPRSQGR